MKPAVLITWPKHVDFPICRYNLLRFKDYFSSIHIAFSEHHRDLDLSNFIREQLPFCNFVDVVRTRDDWRDDAVNNLLDKTQNEKYILFLEQDFLIKDASFFDIVFKKEYDLVYYREIERVHPAFALVKRELIDKTSKCFAVYPPGDHFYKFFSELPVNMNFTFSLEELGLKERENFYHMAGLSQNYVNFQYGDPFYKPNNFLYYVAKSMQLPIVKHPQFDQTHQAINRTYGCPKTHVFLDKFFPL